MSKYYVTGGAQRARVNGVQEWFSYGEASIFIFDDLTGEVSQCASYNTPGDIRPAESDANVVFKAGSIHGDRLVVCTQTEILTYSLPGFVKVGYLSHPWLNDVHHVMVAENGNYLIANTGLDMVLELTQESEVVREIAVIPGDDIWQRFDRDIDYRKVATTKPHHAHPNFVFEVGDELWVSRFVQQDAICLTAPHKVIPVGVESIHDGNLFGDKIYFTTVNGHVVVADPIRCEVLADYDLNKITDSNRTLGWCRGLSVLTETKVIVGFSRLRPSKFRENVRWVKHLVGKREFAGGLPTRVVQFDLAEGVIDWTIDLEEYNLNAVFSILPASGLK